MSERDTETMLAYQDLQAERDADAHEAHLADVNYPYCQCDLVPATDDNICFACAKPFVPNG